MGPLKDIKVIEMAGIGPAPFCGMILADMGAEVISVERITAPGRGSSSDIASRGKKSIAVDIRIPEGQDIIKKLVESADVLIEGFRPGVMEKNNLGPDELLNINPKLIFGRMTGWGQNGPLANAAGHDINYIALAGALHSIGVIEKPTVPLNLIGDYGGGTMFLAFGVCAALLSASKTGKGQVVDAAMIDGVSTLTSIFYSLSQSGLWDVNKRGMNLLDGGAPFYQVYETKDHKFISLGSLEPQFYQLLIEKLDLQGEFNNQLDMNEWPKLKDKLESIFKTKTISEWNKLFEGTDVCYAPVLSINEAKDHPHMIDRNNFIEVEGVIQPAPAPRFSSDDKAEIKKAPEIGQDNNDIMKEIGYSDEEIKKFYENEVI